MPKDVNPGHGRLELFAGRFATQALQRHLFFWAATLFVIFFNGYHFGTFDQAAHIPFLKKFADPSLFPNDRFLDLRFLHYSYFWFLFQPFYQFGVLEVAMFITHLIATYATFWVLWALSDTLFHNPITSVISIAALAFPHLGFGGWPVFEFSLLNRTFVLPFLLLSIILFLRQRFLLAFAILGLMYNLHVISVNFVLAMFLFDCIIEWRRIGWRNIVLGIMLFIVAALPVLIWRLIGSPVDFSLRPEWYSVVALGMLANHFYLFLPYPHILLATAGGAGAFALFFIAHHKAPSPEHSATSANFIYAVLLIQIVQVVTAQWFPITFIIESQIIRAGVFALIFGYLYFANYLGKCYESKAMNKFDFGLLSGAFVLSLFAFIPAIILALQRLIAAPRLRQLITSGALMTLLAYTVGLGLSLNIWYPGVYIFAHQTPWYDVQIWARNNTPKDTVFITPPHMWWFYYPDWRIFSERSTMVTIYELAEMALAPDYTSFWRPRFDALAPGALARFKGNTFENLSLTAQAYYSLSREDLLRAACESGASYIVLEKPHLFDFTVAYENEQFVVYAPGSDVCKRSSH